MNPEWHEAINIKIFEVSYEESACNFKRLNLEKIGRTKGPGLASLQVDK
jgi:hypothetical protein